MFIDTPMKVNNPDYKKFGFEPIDKEIRSKIGVVIGLNQVQDINKFVEEVIKNKDKYKQKIIKSREKFVFNFGNSSAAGAEFIKGFINEAHDEA